MVLDLVDGGQDGAVRQQLLQISLAVLCRTSRRVRVSPASVEGESSPTLQTPMALTLPVPRSASICFQASTWSHPRTTSREPSGSVGNLSWLPVRSWAQQGSPAWSARPAYLGDSAG